MKKIVISESSLHNKHTDERNIHENTKYLYIMTHTEQLKIVSQLKESVTHKHNDHNTIKRAIQKKLKQYIYQDKGKEYMNVIREYKTDSIEYFNNEHLYITCDEIIQKMVDQQLRCYYCIEPVFILYRYKRYNKQWTLERLNNHKGHIANNCVIACLQCNISRGDIINYSDFKYTKQVKINKHS